MAASTDAPEWKITSPAEYQGMCDASAAVAVSSNLFLVGNDEDNVLRLYRSDQPGPPVKQFNMNDFLQVKGKSPEADLEAAARIGNRAFWMGSHGRNRNAKERSNRHRFFATDILLRGSDVELAPVGKPCKHLLEPLFVDARFASFHLREASELAPKQPGALDIEGLAATPDGHLLIGFRNPIPEEKALLVPLLNPNQVLVGQRPEFGAALLLDLGGRGVRDMVLHEGKWMLIAGSANSKPDFQLYSWSGPGTSPSPLRVSAARSLNDYNPEALIIYPDRGFAEFQVLSDDGARLFAGVPGKELEPSQQRFRSFWLSQLR